MKKFVVRDYRISLDEKRFQGCGLVTAVLLSDLHGVWHGEGQKALVKAVKDQNPDLILSAGDLITAGGPCDGVYALMEKLAGTYPVFAGNGNHETKLREEEPESYEVYEGELKRLGVQMLRNEKASLTIHSLPIEVAGLEIGKRTLPENRCEKSDRFGDGRPPSTAFQGEVFYFNCPQSCAFWDVPLLGGGSYRFRPPAWGICASSWNRGDCQSPDAPISKV